MDDSPEKHVKNYGNLLRVRPYEGAVDDDELLALATYLVSLASLRDVRSIEKRRWRK